MKTLFRTNLGRIILGAAAFLATIIQPGFVSSIQAQGGNADESNPVSEDTSPFQLPFAQPPGPDTWLLAQPYGNTVGAYFQRNSTYGASGGIHFGVDLAAPCGTEIVAIADGVVFAVDGPFGSPPHNLMIDHPLLEYSSMYGHLLEAPTLRVGQTVKQGQVVAVVGDSRGNCNGSPHLHLEIRDLKHFGKFNPLNLIDADWNRLALYSSWGRGFMRNLDDPRQWQQLYDQPRARIGGPIVNDFARTWPLDWSKSTVETEAVFGDPVPAEVAQLGLDLTRLSPARVPAPVEPVVVPGARQITKGDCCTNFFWSADSTEVQFVDKLSLSRPAAVWGVNVSQPQAVRHLVKDRLGVYSNDETVLAYPDRQRGLVVIENLIDGERWTIDTQGSGISFTPDGRLLWTEYDAEVEFRSRQTEVWLADVDGDNATLLAELERGSPVSWMSDTELLVASRIPPENDILLSMLSLEDGTVSDLALLPRTRGSAFSPDKRYLVYLVRFNIDPDENGVWLLDLEDPHLKSQPLPFFGAYRWRDNQHLVYTPFSPEGNGHTFYEYDVVSGESYPLFPKDGSSLNLAIANNDWQVSPDGRKIALIAAKNRELDGIWVIDLRQD